MILVTGGAGFIGSNIVASLNDLGRCDIAVADTLERGEKWRNLAKAALVDFVAPEAVLAWLKRGQRLDAIIHMGAISDTTAADGDAIIATNLRFSIDLLDWCTEAGVPFLYASSAAVYGSGAGGFDDDAAPAQIQALRPLNLYGWSKRQFDYVVADRMARGAPLPPSCIGFRFFNVFGPNEYHKGAMQSIVAKIAGPVARGERVSLFKSYRAGVADGDQRRDFIYVKDAVAAVLSFLGRPGMFGIFNIGTGESNTFRALAEAVFKACDRAPAIDYVAMPESIRDKYQYFTEASVERLRQSGYGAPFTPLDDAVADYVTAYLAGEDPFR